MRIFNQDKTQELFNVDLNKGKLQEDTLTIHHDAVEWVKEVGHMEVVKTYEDGKTDVMYVVDVPGVEGHEAYDEYEPIYIYIPYTKDELRVFEINDRIAELKELLLESDYRTLKYIEGEYTEEEFAPYKNQRHSYREEINELEEELSELNK